MNAQTAPASRIVAAMRRLDTLGLNRSASGNCSVREGHGFWITPSGIPATDLNADQIVPMTMHGEPVSDHMAPSSEWRFHRDIYVQRPEIHAVVHTHSPFATTLACLHQDIPPFHYMIAVAGGNSIRCAPYALLGTQTLSDHAMSALHERNACLLANHGMIAIGKNMDHAMRIAVEVESLCEQYWRALQIGSPHLLSDAEMALVIEKFKTYGPSHTRG